MELDFGKLREINKLIGKEKLIVDLSCRTVIENGKTNWYVAMNKWQTITDTILSAEFLLKSVPTAMSFNSCSRRGRAL